MSLDGRNVTVLGAGVGGLAAAIALARRGARVTVLEQSDAIREVGAGIQISPNGAVVLRALGLTEPLEHIATQAEAVELRDGYSDDLVLRLDMARLRPQQTFYFVHRADLIGLLAKGAQDAGVGVKMLHKVTHVDLSDPAPRLTLENGPQIECDLLIAADGLHSPTRIALGGKGTPFFTGQVAWRAVIPNTQFGAIAEVHLGTGKHLVSYPLRNGQWRNIVAIEERARWVEESWTLREDPMQMRLAFGDFSPRVKSWLDQIDDVWCWGLHRRPVASVWGKTTTEGAAFILGDAAHSTLPFLAQGACMALEDAWVLADLLEQNSDDIALSHYAQTRVARCQRIVAGADSNARAYHLSGLPRWIGHLGLRTMNRFAPELAMRRFDWLYDHDVTRRA